MSPSDPNTTDPTDPAGESSAELPAVADYVAAFRAKDGSIVIYDEREHTAWVQSDAALDINDAR